MPDTSIKEILIKGMAGAQGIAIGDIALLETKNKPVAPTSIKKKEVKKEKEKFVHAKDQLAEELIQLKKEVDTHESIEIIDTQLQIALDPDIEINVFNLVENNLLSAEFAVYQSYSEYIERLQESGSDLFRQRIIDLEDVRDSLIEFITKKAGSGVLKKNSIIITTDLSPTELLSLYEQGISGIVMDTGGKTSHAAIIAQSLGIPCVVSAKTAVKTAVSCKKVIIDGDSGEIYFNPGKERINQFRKILKKTSKKSHSQKEQSVFETLDGFPFRLFSNIEFEAELPKVKESGAPSIGLLRTECLLFGKRPLKKAEEQIGFYTSILAGVPGSVTIRLFDVGGDKMNIRAENEANPFLGWRGIRMLLAEKELLRNQLQAILQVAGENPGRIKILVPMVSVVEEVIQIRNEMETIQKALISSGKKVDEQVPLGVMVEVPAVAISAYQFAREVDFFSMGTNDLTQYTMAVDRGNEHITSLFQHYHPSVLKLIQLTVEGAVNAEIEVSACGELAGTEIGAACMFGLGVNELSMAPNSIARIKLLLTSKRKKDFEDLAAQAIKAATSTEVEQLYKKWKNN